MLIGQQSAVDRNQKAERTWKKNRRTSVLGQLGAVNRIAKRTGRGLPVGERNIDDRKAREPGRYQRNALHRPTAPGRAVTQALAADRDGTRASKRRGPPQAADGVLSHDGSTM